MVGTETGLLSFQQEMNQTVARDSAAEGTAEECCKRLHSKCAPLRVAAYVDICAGLPCEARAKKGEAGQHTARACTNASSRTRALRYTSICP